MDWVTNTQYATSVVSVPNNLFDRFQNQSLLSCASISGCWVLQQDPQRCQVLSCSLCFSWIWKVSELFASQAHKVRGYFWFFSLKQAAPFHPSQERRQHLIWRTKELNVWKMSLLGECRIRKQQRFLPELHDLASDKYITLKKPNLTY